MVRRNYSLDLPILQSAKREFLNKGYEKASLNDICKGAGVTTGAIYKRYKGKEDLFNVLVDETYKEFTNYMSKGVIRQFKEMSDKELINVWNMNEETIEWLLHILNERREEFILLFTCSDGTSYSNFHNEWAIKRTEVSYLYYEEAYRRKLTKTFVSKDEIQVLMSSFWITMYEPIINGFSADEFRIHCNIVCKLFNWRGALGFKS